MKLTWTQMWFNELWMSTTCRPVLFFNAKLLAKQNNNINNLPLVRILALLALRDCSWSSILPDIAGLLKARRLFHYTALGFLHQRKWKATALFFSTLQLVPSSNVCRAAWTVICDHHWSCEGSGFWGLPRLWFTVGQNLFMFFQGNPTNLHDITGFPVGRAQGAFIDQLGYNILGILWYADMSRVACPSATSRGT